jgi:hypothetical protein
MYLVVAKRYGDSVTFTVDEDQPKAALQAAKTQANQIFDYKPGEAGAPTVSIKPVVEEE